MNPRLIDYYNEELAHLREVGGEFAAAYPKVAARLGLDQFECADPYVERLLEGFSFLTARVRMKLDAQFPRFTQHLAEIVYPHYCAPTPSMAIVQVEPNYDHPKLVSGSLVPRGTALQSVLGAREVTRCEYRTAHALTLWPLRVVQAEYFRYSGAIDHVQVDVPALPQAALRLRIEAVGATPPAALGIDTLPVYLRGGERLAGRLYETLTAHAMGVLVMPAEQPSAWHRLLSADAIRPLGFSDDEALLPPSPLTFRGLRLVTEYFALPERYLFVEFSGLREALRECSQAAFDLIVLLDRYDDAFERAVQPSHFALHCTPAINLFNRRADRIALADGQAEFQVVVDRTRPLDFEVYGIESVEGFHSSRSDIRRFVPFYRAHDPYAGRSSGGAYFQMHREARRLSERAQRTGGRSRYHGTEVFVSLVDEDDAPFASDLHQLGAQVLCTNRDLPLSMPLGSGRTDFTLGIEVPVDAIRVVSGPTMPRPPLAEGALTWRLLNLLSLNYLSLSPSGAGGGESDADALRALLTLHCRPDDDFGHRQISGLLALRARNVTRRLQGRGPIAFGRGLELTTTFDEDRFEGTGCYLLGAVLHAFFSGYVSINHFAETVVCSSRRGELKRWRAKAGVCPIV